MAGATDGRLSRQPQIHPRALLQSGMQTPLLLIIAQAAVEDVMHDTKTTVMAEAGDCRLQP